jgi:hypothetical protein
MTSAGSLLQERCDQGIDAFRYSFIAECKVPLSSSLVNPTSELTRRWHVKLRGAAATREQPRPPALRHNVYGAGGSSPYSVSQTLSCPLQYLIKALQADQRTRRRLQCLKNAGKFKISMIISSMICEIDRLNG